MAVLKDLIVHGQSRFVNGINANSIKADEGIFNQLIAVDLKATDATIENLTATNARVTQTLTANHISTNSWEAANIANVGGNFYISPTGEQSGTITVTIARTAAPGTDGGTYTLTFGATSPAGFGVNSTSSTYWSSGARVMATGEVSYNNSKRYPLGTCEGAVSGSVTISSNNITGIAIAGVKSEALDVLFTDMGIAITASSGNLSGCIGYKLKISLYERYSSSNYYPIGILLTSLGKDKQQYIDIYSGTNSAGSSYTGFANPALRIGQLDGLPNIVDGSTASDTTPSGWGIYTTNGFFKGKIVSNAGKIGNFTISNDLYSGTTGIGRDTNVYISPGIASTQNIADGGTSSKTWAFTAGANFGVTTNGILYAKGAQLSGNVAATQGFTVTSSVGGATLASMTGSGITLGQTSGGQYNVLVDNAGIKLRYNTSVLNLIDTSGMKLYLSSDTSNAVAQFGSTTQIGKTANAHINITSGGLDLYRGTTDLIAHFGYNENDITTPYLTFGRRDSTDNPGFYSVAFGQGSHGGGDYSFVSGDTSTANGNYSHAEGNSNLALGDYSFVIGDHNTINTHGSYSFITGQNGETDYTYNFLSGVGLQGGANYQAIFGKYNQEDDEAMFIIGNGNSDEDRSNLMAVGDDYIRIGNTTDYHTIIEGDSFQINSLEGQLFSIANSGLTKTVPIVALQRGQNATVFKNVTTNSVVNTKQRSFVLGYIQPSITYVINLTLNGATRASKTYNSDTDGLTSFTLSYNDATYGNATTTFSFEETTVGLKVTIAQTLTKTIPAAGTTDGCWNGILITYNGIIDVPKLSFAGAIIAQEMAGMIQMYAGATPPAGWLICDGTAVSRETYANLFAVIGTTYGTGDGSTTFNLPDLRGRTPIGAGQGSGLTYRTLGTQNIGSETVTLTTSQIPSHTHKASASASFVRCTTASANMGRTTVASGSGKSNVVTSASAIGSGETTYAEGGGGAHSNMQPSAVVNFIICTGKTYE